MYHIYTHIHQSHSLLPCKQVNKNDYPRVLSLPRTLKKLTVHLSPSVSEALRQSYIKCEIADTLLVKFLQNSSRSITTCHLLHHHSPQQFIVIPFLTDTSI